MDEVCETASKVEPVWNLMLAVHVHFHIPDQCYMPPSSLPDICAKGLRTYIGSENEVANRHEAGALCGCLQVYKRPSIHARVQRLGAHVLRYGMW